VEDGMLRGADRPIVCGAGNSPRPRHFRGRSNSASATGLSLVLSCKKNVSEVWRGARTSGTMAGAKAPLLLQSHRNFQMIWVPIIFISGAPRGPPLMRITIFMNAVSAGSTHPTPPLPHRMRNR